VIYAQPKIEMIRDKFYALIWHDVYSLMEFTATFLDEMLLSKRKRFINDCNFFMERENAAYRFVGDQISPITSVTEINEIELSLVAKDEAAVHIESALTLLSNKEKDQSRESIGQSISAVEAKAKKVVGNTKATLAELCQKLKIIPQHDQLVKALHNLYNYTSGKDGIRHGLTEESMPVNPALARFMLVTCSAFVNLIESETELSPQKIAEHTS